MPDVTTSVSRSPARPRGRPRQSEDAARAVRERIVAATAQVFAEHGSHGMSVALIIERAGIARPTFYRYFANAEEPLQAVLDASDHALLEGLQAALDAASDEVHMVVAGIDAYLQWARDLGPALPPLFAELHDPSSPVSAHREHTLGLLRARLGLRLEHLGRRRPHDADIDVLLNTFEYIGYRVARVDRVARAPRSADGEGTDPSHTDMAWARQTMARVAVALLGTPDELAEALEIPDLLRPSG